MKNKITAAVAAIITIAGAVRAETLTYASVWNKINQSSAAQEASQLQTESLVATKVQASRHWFPKLYLDVKSYRTDDPGSSFFGLLEQRSIGQSDFNPDAINHPGGSIYTRGTLGLDWTLYEGGMKSSQVEMYERSVAAQKAMTSQVQIEQYSLVGRSYGSIAVLEKQKNSLESLRVEIVRMIKSYQLGSRSNPVGYSGLLGMKSLLNRVTGLINQYEAQSRAYYAALSEMGLRDLSWSPEIIDSNLFVARYFSDASNEIITNSSYKIESAKENVKASEEVVYMEKAKFLPRVGAFAESFIFNGDRDTAQGYTAGLYLRWNLFDPSDYGSLRVATLKSTAAAKYSEAAEQQERAERAALTESLKSLQQNIELLNDSQKLLSEQAKMTLTLFKNGSINTLQLVEILSRRADLIAEQGEAELSLIKAGSEIVTKQKFDVGARVRVGQQKEQKNEKR